MTSVDEPSVRSTTRDDVEEIGRRAEGSLRRILEVVTYSHRLSLQLQLHDRHNGVVLDLLAGQPLPEWPQSLQTDIQLEGLSVGTLSFQDRRTASASAKRPPGYALWNPMRERRQQGPHVLATTVARAVQDVLGDERRAARQRVWQLHEYQLAIGSAQVLAQGLRPRLPMDPLLLAHFDKLYGQIRRANAQMHNLARGAYLSPPPYTFSACALNEVVALAELQCVAGAQKKGVEIVIDLKPEIMIIDGSLEHLQHAFDNILHNGIKYSYETSRLSRQRHVDVVGRPQGDGYEISVINYGIGIEENERDLVFQPGYRGRLTTAEHRQGAGIGLHLAKTIIQAHHGFIRVRSVQLGEPSDGFVPHRTNFVVWLPRRQSSSTIPR